jgi:PAS domain-containing protein
MGENFPSWYEVQYITKSGEIRWADLSSGIIQYGGKPAVIVLLVGITERKATERILHETYERLAASEEEVRAQCEAMQENLIKVRKSEEDYRLIIENIQDAFYRTDNQGTLTMVSP